VAPPVFIDWTVQFTNSSRRAKQQLISGTRSDRGSPDGQMQRTTDSRFELAVIISLWIHHDNVLARMLRFIYKLWVHWPALDRRRSSVWWESWFQRLASVDILHSSVHRTCCRQVPCQVITTYLPPWNILSALSHESSGYTGMFVTSDSATVSYETGNIFILKWLTERNKSFKAMHTLADPSDQPMDKVK